MSGMNDDSIKWDPSKKEARDTERNKEFVLREGKRLWGQFRRKIQGAVRMTIEQLDAEVVALERSLGKLLIGKKGLESYREFTRTLIADARRRVNLMDKPVEEVAETIMEDNNLLLKNSDGSEGECWGFQTTEALLAVPAVQNCADADLVGFALHKSILVAIYEGKLKPWIKMIGQVKYPEKVKLPSLEAVAAKFKAKNLEFPDMPEGGL